MPDIVLASKSIVRKNILEENKISCIVKPSNIDEEPIKESLILEGATPELISKNLAELKANIVSLKKREQLVIGADSVIDFEGKIVSKPTTRKQALDILNELNGKKHHLISSVCISKNGKMVWNNTDKAELIMKNFTNDQFEQYLSKISDEDLYAYNIYQIEGPGKDLFIKIKGDENTIMGLPIINIKSYLNSINK